MRITQSMKCFAAHFMCCSIWFLLASSWWGMTGDRTTNGRVEQDPEIQAMVQLRNAYGKQDMHRFEAILGDKSNHIADDAVIQENLAPLMHNFRSQVALKLVRPYHSVRISYLAGELNIGEEDMEHLLVGLILDGRLVGALDQVEGVLRLSSKSVAVNKTYSALSAAVDSLERLRSSGHGM